MIIGLMGKMGSGKDETFKQLKVYFGENVVRLAFADVLKGLLKKYFKVTDKQLKTKPPKIRTLLQNIGDLVGEVNLHYFRDHVKDHIEYEYMDRIASLDKHVIITDVRLKHEHSLIKDYNGKIIKIERPNNPKGLFKTTHHHTETDIESLSYDFLLINDGNKKRLRLNVSDWLKNITWDDRH